MSSTVACSQDAFICLHVLFCNGSLTRKEYRSYCSVAAVLNWIHRDVSVKAAWSSVCTSAALTNLIIQVDRSTGSRRGLKISVWACAILLRRFTKMKSNENKSKLWLVSYLCFPDFAVIPDWRRLIPTSLLLHHETNCFIQGHPESTWGFLISLNGM